MGQIVEEYPKGSKKVFSIPMRPHFTRDQTETSADGRAFLGDLPWNVIVVHNDKFTVTGINSAMRAHLRFGHISLDKIHCIQGNPVTWSIEKQTNVALSTSEAEYIAITSGFKEAKYFINLMQVEMKLRVTPIRSRVDNIGAGYMAEQSVTNKRTKHINLRYHYVREEISEFKNFEMEYVATKANTSDIFTKPLDRGLGCLKRGGIRLGR